MRAARAHDARDSSQDPGFCSRHLGCLPQGLHNLSTTQNPLSKAAVKAWSVAVLLAVAGCGGSSDPARAKAVSQCQRNGASRAGCECAVSYALAHGDSADRLTQEMVSHTAGTDPVAVRSGILCAGAR